MGKKIGLPMGRVAALALLCPIFFSGCAAAGDNLFTPLLSSANYTLLYIILIVIWTSSVIRRAMQKSIRRAVLLMGIILLGWITVRLLKYQMPLGILNRYFWYGYYLFLLALLLVLLWLAWVIDQPEDKAKPPKWSVILAAAVGGVLAVLVFTNDLHHWVFRLDLSKPNWHTDYNYGPGYYLVMVICVATALAALAMMLIKSKRNPRKSRVAFPLALCALLAAYGAGFLLHIPLVWTSDVTMVYGLFALLFLETSIRAGMIPVNSKYKQLFTHSPLAMQIIDHNGDTVLFSASAPLRRDDDALLFAVPIAGGQALWQEDISALNRLHREVEASVRKLTAANTLLAKEERVKRAIEEENARTHIMSQLEAEIAAHTARLSAMIENSESAARIVLLICYIKRRCNLFFRERETQLLSAGELMIYVDELAEFAGYTDVRIITANQLEAPVELRRATLFYDFFYHVVDWATNCACSSMLAHLGPEQALKLLLSEDARAFRLEESLQAAIASAGGGYAVNDLDGVVSIRLAFPEGGEANG